MSKIVYQNCAKNIINNDIQNAIKNDNQDDYQIILCQKYYLPEVISKMPSPKMMSIISLIDYNVLFKMIYRR